MKPLELPGIEPGASCMQNTRSTTELQPLTWWHMHFILYLTVLVGILWTSVTRDGWYFCPDLRPSYATSGHNTPPFFNFWPIVRRSSVCGSVASFFIRSGKRRPFAAHKWPEETEPHVKDGASGALVNMPADFDVRIVYFSLVFILVRCYL